MGNSKKKLNSRNTEFPGVFKKEYVEIPGTSIKKEVQFPGVFKK